MSLQAIARIMADKVYTSAEFKRERDNFHVSTHNRSRAPNCLRDLPREAILMTGGATIKDVTYNTSMI